MQKFDTKTFQGLILALQDFWARQGCAIVQPLDMEVGAGTFHPQTFLRSIGPEPIRLIHQNSFACRSPSCKRTPVLETERVHVAYPGGVRALDGVTLPVAGGETLILVGESGSGKSVTMMSLLRLIPIPPGKIEDGEARFATEAGFRDLLQMDVDDLRAWYKTWYIPNNATLVVAGDIRENVIAVLQDTLNAIKTTVTSKTEYFI